MTRFRLGDDFYAYFPETRILHITHGHPDDPRYERYYLADEEHLALMDWLNHRSTYIKA